MRSGVSFISGPSYPLSLDLSFPDRHGRLPLHYPSARLIFHSLDLSIYPSPPLLPVQRAVLDRFAAVAGIDIGAAFQVGYGARHLQDAVDDPGVVAHLVDGVLLQGLAGGILFLIILLDRFGVNSFCCDTVDLCDLSTIISPQEDTISCIRVPS